MSKQSKANAAQENDSIILSGKIIFTGKALNGLIN